MEKKAKNNITKLALIIILNIIICILSIFPISNLLRPDDIAIIISISVGLGLTLLLILFSNIILLNLNGAKKIDKIYENKLNKLVENISSQFEINKPSIRLIDESNINVLSIGKSNNKNYICITKGALDNLNNDELEYLITYEIIKIVKRETAVQTISTVTLGLIIIISDLFFRSILRSIQKKGKESESFMRLLLTSYFILITPMFMWLMQLFIPTGFDMINDTLSLEFKDKSYSAVTIFNKIKNINFTNSMYSRACTNMFFVNPLIGQKVSKKYSYHTDINKRINNIKK